MTKVNAEFTNAADVFDAARVPAGLEDLENTLEIASNLLGKRIDQLKVLDCGIGTGNYI